MKIETIHPFCDGNGRTGRIINILYLILKKLPELPVLYLSRYIIRHKNDYYRLLQKVRVIGEWEEWILFMLEGVEQTAIESIILIRAIKNPCYNNINNPFARNCPKYTARTY